MQGLKPLRNLPNIPRWYLARWTQTTVSLSPKSRFNLIFETVSKHGLRIRSSMCLLKAWIFCLIFYGKEKEMGSSLDRKSGLAFVFFWCQLCPFAAFSLVLRWSLSAHMLHPRICEEVSVRDTVDSINQENCASIRWAGNRRHLVNKRCPSFA